MFIALALALYKSLGLLYVIIFFVDIPFHQILIHGILAAACCIFVLWHYDLYWKTAEVSTAFWKMSLTGNVAGGKLLAITVEMMSIIYGYFYRSYYFHNGGGNG